MLPVLRRTLRSLLKVLRHNRKVFVLTFIQRSAQHSLTALSDELTKLNPRVEFAQTYPGRKFRVPSTVPATHYTRRSLPRAITASGSASELASCAFPDSPGHWERSARTTALATPSNSHGSPWRRHAPAPPPAVLRYRHTIAQSQTWLQDSHACCIGYVPTVPRPNGGSSICWFPGSAGSSGQLHRRSALPPRRSAARSCARSGTKSRRHARRYSTCSTGWIHHRLRPYKSTSQMLTTGILREIFAF